jgi:monoamine oxidase
MSEATEVIVIGAGIAGLAAANKLRSLDYDVLVLEARDRIGGRIWTDHSWNLPIELGAAWIHGTEGNPVMDLAHQFGLKTQITDYENHWLYNAQGKLVKDSVQEAIEERLEDVLEEVEYLREIMADEKVKDIPLQQAIDEVLTGWRLSTQQRLELNYAIAAEIEHDYAADSTQLSCYHWDEGDAFDGDDCLFPKGYDQLVKTLADPLDIRLEQVVQQVSYDKKGVCITSDRGTFTADYAILTLPLGVLKANVVEFSPPLPALKQAVIRRLGMGLLNKVVLRFPEVFWDQEAEVIGYIAPTKGEWPEFFNLQPVTGEPILVGFTAGTYAQELEGWSDEEIVASAMNVLHTLYGKAIPEPQAWQIVRWRSDPYSRGAYSFIPPGATDEDYDVLAKPVGNRLFFAGEATSRRYAATVHGALLSGWREADRINNID